MDRSKYFDHAATTPLDSQVREAMIPWLGESFGNSESIHAWGRAAHEAVEQARGRVAELVGAEDPLQIVLTSGATESNNTVLRHFKNVAFSPYEHSSIREPLSNRSVSPPHEIDLTCLSAVGSEIGNCVTGFAYGSSSLIDATQAVGKIEFEVGEADFVSLSSHKIYGPQGVGALYVRDPSSFTPLIFGGGQQSGLRSGTLNVAGIVGFGLAAERAKMSQKEDHAHATALRQIVCESVGKEAVVNQSPNFSPFILSLTFEGVLAETLVIEMDHLGFAISAGSACAARSVEPSPALLAFGLSASQAMSTVRVSFGRCNTEDRSREMAQALVGVVRKLRG